MKNISKLALLGMFAAILVGCGDAGGAVDVGSVESQREKEKKLNEAAQQNLPPGDGSAG